MTASYISIEKSPRAAKKWKATFYDSNKNKIKSIHFGAEGYEDYTMHHDDKRRDSYLARHSNEDWEDPLTAGALSRWILWEDKDFNTAVSKYLQKFNLQQL